VSNFPAISFVTPYLSGPEMMEIHLASIRKFYPFAPILVSKKGGGLEEMEDYRRTFDIRYSLEECAYHDALFRLLERCETDYVCILDHDTVLLSSLDPLLNGLGQGSYDLVGIEERIRTPEWVWKRLWPEIGGWMRFAPGYMDATFLMFNLRTFQQKWGLRGLVRNRPLDSAPINELHYGLCEKLSRHEYLMPYHVPKYGMGNLLVFGGTTILWHQWYGSYRARQLDLEPASPETLDPDGKILVPVLERGESAFLADYPNLDFSGLVPAWGPECDVVADSLAFARANKRSRTMLSRSIRRVQTWHSYGLRGCWARASARLDRWWRLR
jgi:hypothetical protein